MSALEKWNRTAAACFVMLMLILAGAGCSQTGSGDQQSGSSNSSQLSTTSPRSAGFDPARLEVLHATTKRFVDEKKHAGIITLLLRDGKVVDFQAYGYRDVEKQLPMERDTICRMYSMSKIITCAAVLILMEDGKFNLDDPVANYLPELKDMKVWTGGTADAP